MKVLVCSVESSDSRRVASLSRCKPSAWYRQFRELMLTAAVYSLEHALTE